MRSFFLPCIPAAWQDKVTFRKAELSMDFHSSYQYHTPQESKRRSKRMENAALILGVIAIATPCLVYPALICGALAIVFALLSRGGEHTLAPRAKIGLILGSIGLGIVLLMIIYTFAVAEVYYGGILNLARELYGSLGIDFDALMDSYYQ